MSKTTRELAEFFGVSKQAIEKKYTPEFKAKYMSKVTTNGVPTWLVADEGVNALKSVFQGTNQDTNSLPTDDRLLTALEGQIQDQKNQIENLQKLLDQSQQLLLSEQKKNQMLLESKTELSDAEWEEEKTHLENLVADYRSSLVEANSRASNNYAYAENVERWLWVAGVIAGVFLILLLVLGWLYLKK